MSTNYNLLQTEIINLLSVDSVDSVNFDDVLLKLIQITEKETLQPIVDKIVLNGQTDHILQKLILKDSSEFTQPIKNIYAFHILFLSKQANEILTDTKIDTFLFTSLQSNEGIQTLAYVIRELMYLQQLDTTLLLNLCIFYKNNTWNNMDEDAKVHKNILNLIFMVFPNNLEKLKYLLFYTVSDNKSTLKEKIFNKLPNKIKQFLQNDEHEKEMEKINIQNLFNFNNIVTAIEDDKYDLTPLLWKVYEFGMFPKVKDVINQINTKITNNNFYSANQAWIKIKETYVTPQSNIGGKNTRRAYYYRNKTKKQRY